MDNVEIAVRLGDILKILGWSRSKFFRRREELLRRGVIFYRNEGRPPIRRIYAFPSYLKRYLTQQGMTEPLLPQFVIEQIRKENVNREAEEKKKGRIYFVQVGNQEIKIGFTFDVERRIKRIQMDCPSEVRLIGVIKGDRKKEAKIHRKFKEFQKRGEWFIPDKSILEYISEHSIDVKKSYRLAKYVKDCCPRTEESKIVQ